MLSPPNGYVMFLSGVIVCWGWLCSLRRLRWISKKLAEGKDVMMLKEMSAKCRKQRMIEDPWSIIFDGGGTAHCPCACATPHTGLLLKKSLKLYCAYHCCREYFSFFSVEEDTKLLPTDGIAASIWQGIVFNNDSKPLFERGIRLMAKMNTPILFNELYPACFPSFHQWNCHRCAPPLSNFPPFSNKVWSCGDTIQIPSISFCC